MWWVSRGGQVLGPYDDAQLVHHVRGGALELTCLVAPAAASAGAGRAAVAPAADAWRPLGELPALRSLLGPPSPGMMAGPAQSQPGGGAERTPAQVRIRGLWLIAIALLVAGGLAAGGFLILKYWGDAGGVQVTYRGRSATPQTWVAIAMLCVGGIGGPIAVYKGLFALVTGVDVPLRAAPRTEREANLRAPFFLGFMLLFLGGLPLGMHLLMH